jgi:hypothetical protein
VSLTKKNLVARSFSDPAARMLFQAQGWIWLKSFLSLEHQIELRTVSDHLAGQRRESILKYYEIAGEGNKRVLSRIENFLFSEPDLSFLLDTAGPLMQMLDGILEDCPVLFKDKINFKPPWGNGYALHQDAPAYRGFGVSSFVTAMIPIDDSTVENGCIEFGVGKRVLHQLELNPKDEILDPAITNMKCLPIPAESGDVVIFDGLVPHKSGPNRTGLARRAMFLTFNEKKEGDQREAYFRAKRERFPPEEERAVSKNYRISGRQFNLGNPFI